MTFYTARMTLLYTVYFANGLKSGSKFELKSDDHVDSYLGNSIIHDRARGSVTVSQEHYSMACLERFGLANCNGNDKPITSRLTVKDQPATVNTVDQELYRGMVGSLLYLASWTRPDISFCSLRTFTLC